MVGCELSLLQGKSPNIAQASLRMGKWPVTVRGPFMGHHDCTWNGQVKGPHLK
jgi:hypothetical protein